MGMTIATMTWRSLSRGWRPLLLMALPLGGLALAHEAVVHVDAGEAVADGALHEGCGHRGIHAAGEPAQRLAVAHLGTDRGHLLLDDVAGGPRGGQLRAIEEEVLQHLSLIHI